MIYLGSDHGGFSLKEAVKKYLQDRGEEIEDFGASNDSASDYPEYAKLVAERVGTDIKDRGILFCRSGQGMAMAANRFKGVRAAVIWNKKVAIESREDNNSNILSLPADYISQTEAFEIVDAWLSTPFSNEPRHKLRIDEIDS